MTAPFSQLGPYRILEMLGQGGMGAVYRAVHEDLKREVALKVLRPGAVGSDEERRFEREMRMSAKLRHPNIVAVLDGGTEGDVAYLAMELVRGDSLEALMAREGPLPWRRAAALAAGIADGLAYLHEHELLHRDMKPANVMTGEDGVPRILDFGLARRFDSTHLTETGAVVGTLRYLAPETLTAGTYSQRSDLHALGAILWELIAGRPRVTADSGPELLRRIAEDEPELPPLATDALPAPLAKVLLALLARDPAQRPPDARAVGAALRGLDGGAVTRKRGGAVRSGAFSVPPAREAGPSRGALAAGLAAVAVVVGLAVGMLPRAGGTAARPDGTPASSASASPAAPAREDDDPAKVERISAALEALPVPRILEKLAAYPGFDRHMNEAVVLDQTDLVLTLSGGSSRIRTLSPRSKHPGALRQAALEALHLEPAWQEVVVMREELSLLFESKRVGDAAKVRLARGLSRLLDVDLLIVGQRDAATLNFPRLVAGLVQQEIRLLEPGRTYGDAGELPLFRERYGFEIEGYAAWTPVALWAGASEDFRAVLPDLKISSPADAKRAFLFQRTVHVPGPTAAQAAGLASFRAEFLMGSPYALEIDVPCAQGGVLPLVIMQNGTAAWSRAMDGLEPQPGPKPPKTRQPYWWGEERLSIPARLIPPGGTDVTFTYRLPRGIEPIKVSYALQAAFVRAFTFQYRAP